MGVVGLARTIYIRCTYGIFGREITKYTGIYGVYIRFWPTLELWNYKSMAFLTRTGLNVGMEAVEHIHEGLIVRF